MELSKRHDKKEEKLTSLLDILNKIDFARGDSYIHPPKTEESLPFLKDAVYLRDRIYAILRKDRRDLIRAGHPELLFTTNRYSIAIKDKRLHFAKRKVSIIYERI